MAFPEPRASVVINYAYLWHDEARRGQEEGVKDRPCLIVGVRSDETGLIVNVMPITHSPPSREGESVELPHVVKARLGLDDAASWIVTTEFNRFRWPGYDLRPVGRDRPETFAYGVIPLGYLNKVRDQIREHARARSLRQTNRDSPL